MGGEIAKLIVQLRLDDAGFAGKLRGIQGQLGGMSRGFSQMGRGAGQLGAGLARVGTVAAAAAAGGLTAVVTTAASFEQAFTGIEKTVDETATTTFPQLEEAIRSMARSIPVSFEELAGIGEAGGALGIAADDLEDFIDVVARLSVSTNLSSDQAATALGQLGNVLHLSGGEFRDFADSLVALGNAGASTEDQIVQMAARFGAAGNSAGLSKEEILALSSAVASMGIQVEAGGSALSRIFSAVATNIGTSSEKAVAFADTLGLSAAEFRKAWEKDALGTFQDFLTELNKLDQFAQASLLKDIGITNTRDVNTVRLMGQNVGFVADQLDIANNAQGALNKESQKFFDTTIGQWQILKNNMRDAGVTIGKEVLPVVTELIKEFAGFLNQPGTRKNLQSFGKDLASGIREVVDQLKGADFSGLINGMKLAGDIASRAFGLFRSLPPEVQALAVSAIALNKVSGGGVGLIAKGFGNLIGGAIKVAFPKLDIFSRGSPANPMFVVVQGGLPGVGGTPAAGGGAKGIIGGIAKFVLGPAAAAIIGNEIGHAIFFDPAVKPAVEFETQQFNQLLAVSDPASLQRGIDAIDQGLSDLTGPNGNGILSFLAGDQVQILKDQRTALEAQLAEAEKTRAAGLENNKTEQQLLEEAKRGRLATTAAGERLKELTLEQRLIKDNTYKQHLDAQEFIRILRKTSEFGEKGKGTAIEQGPRTGRDPFGRAFLALARRLENPKAPRVLGEINRHIIAAEGLQAKALRQGDVHAARLLQRTIDGLHRLIGTVDRNDATSHRNQRDQERRTADVARQVGNQRLATERGFARANASLGIVANKDFSPNINLQSNTTVNVLTAAGQIIQQTRIENAISGNGVGGAPNVLSNA